MIEIIYYFVFGFLTLLFISYVIWIKKYSKTFENDIVDKTKVIKLDTYYKDGSFGFDKYLEKTQKIRSKSLVKRPKSNNLKNK